eukprot:g17945.t1
MGRASDGHHELGHGFTAVTAASNDGPQSEALGSDRKARGARAMAVWKALLLLGVLGGTVAFANSLALHNEEWVLGRGRRDQGRASSRGPGGEHGNGTPRLEINEHPDHPAGAADAVVPRILTVLTTYDKRSALIKEYKEAVLDRQDGYHPEIFVVSNKRDEDPYGVVDFKVGSRRSHRSNAAVAEATSRYAGTFDWIALGDDDTAFMYNRAMNFLSHIDHTKPVTLGRVDGLTSAKNPATFSQCYSPEEKEAPTNQLVANGCCQDFSNPCEVPAFAPDIDMKRTDTLQYYGPNNGLYWAYGGSGFFMSASLAVDVVGAEGWALCAQIFVRSNTDVQIAQCLKMHGYSVGAYPQGFDRIRAPTSSDIQRHLTSNCEVLGFHLGLKHLITSRQHRPETQYTPEAFRAAVAAVRDADTLSARDDEDTTAHCHEAWASFPK